MTLITGSYIRTFQSCPRKAHYEHVLRRVPHYRSAAMDIGTIWHIAADAKLSKRDWQAEVAVAIREHDPTTDYGVKVIDEWSRLAHLVDTLPDALPQDMEIIATELPLTSRYSWHSLFCQCDVTDECTWCTSDVGGRLDALVRWQGGYWSLQYKTMANNGNIEHVLDNLRRGTHEVLYHALARRAYNDLPFFGTIAVIAKKLSNKSFHMEPRPQQLWVTPIPRDGKFVDSRIDEDILPVISLIESGTTRRNAEACHGFGTCPYVNVCWNDDDIADDTLFRTAPDRYADVAEDA